MATSRTQIKTPIQRLLGDDFNLPVFLNIFRRSLLWIILFVLASLTAVFLYLRYTYPTYESTTRLIYKQNEARQALDFLGRPQGSPFNNLEIIRSRIILGPVLEKLPLQVSYFERGRSNLLNTEFYKTAPFDLTAQVKNSTIHNQEIDFAFTGADSYTIRYELDRVYEFKDRPFGKLLETPHFDCIISYGGEFDKGLLKREFFFKINSEQQLIQWISKRLTMTPYTSGGQILQIDMQDRLPNRAVEILNEISRVYIEKDVERQQQSAENVLDFVQMQLDTITKGLTRYETSLKEFKLENKMLNPEAASTRMWESMNEREQERVDLLLEMQALDWLEDYVRSGQSLEALSSELIDLQYQGYSSYLESMRSLQNEIEQLKVSYKEPHLQIQHLQKRLAEVRDNLFKNLANARNRLQIRMDYIEKEIGEFDNRFEGLSEMESRYVQLSRRQNTFEKYYLNLLDKQTEYEIRRASIVENFDVLEHATGFEQIAPRTRLLQIGGLAIGLVLGMVLVILRYLLQNRIQTVQEVEEHSDVPMLGMVPTFHRQEGGNDLFVFNNPKSMVTESFRTMRSNLEFINSEPGPKTMAITSTVSGEGKTYIALNLGGVISMTGKKVIILDLDMRKPKIHKNFDTDNLQGMSTVLIGKHSWQECVQQAEENLHFITSGPLPPNPAELILSENLKNLLADLKTHYDYVLCDTPPVGLVADALDLVKGADYPIYVIRHDFSRKEFINFPNKLYHESGIKHLGLVLNDVNLKRTGYGGYSYGYGYGYGYGYTYGEGYYAEARGRKRPLYKRLFTR